MRTGTFAITVLAACASAPPAPALDHAGGPRDEGAGALARASVKLLLDPGDGRAVASASGGTAYGGGIYGGAAYAGAASAVAWGYTPPDRAPSYIVTDNLHGAIDGTVRWAGARPPRVVSKCGAIDDPSVRVGGDGGVGGIVVYITRIAIGRPLATSWRPPPVGGLVVKHGCALYPAAQVVAPTPAEIVIHGDATHTKLAITPGHGDAIDPPRSHPATLRGPAGPDLAIDPPRSHPATLRGPAGPDLAITMELQEGGRAQLDATPGVTRIASADGTVGSAWVIAIDTPYYAITDDAGHFRIDELAPGNYDVVFWQAPLAHVKDGVFSYGPPTIAHRAVRVDNGRPASLALTLPR